MLRVVLRVVLRLWRFAPSRDPRYTWAQALQLMWSDMLFKWGVRRLPIYASLPRHPCSSESLGSYLI